MLFLKDKEFKPLNFSKTYQLVSKQYERLFITISIISDQKEITDNIVNLYIELFEGNNNTLYRWNLPISSRSIRGIVFDILMRLKATLKDHEAFCLEKFKSDYWIFSSYDDKSKLFKISSVKVSSNGNSLLEFDDLMDLINDKEAAPYTSYISFTRTTMLQIIKDLEVAAELTNIYHYLILQIFPPDILKKLEEGEKI